MSPSFKKKWQLLFQVVFSCRDTPFLKNKTENSSISQGIKNTTMEEVIRIKQKSF